MHHDLLIEPLALHPESLEALVALFEAEWPEWYRSGRGDAKADLQAFSGQGRLPFGVVALLNGSVVGVAALKAESIPSHKHLSPWAAAGLVVPALRGRGIGLCLLHALEPHAKDLGYSKIFCATGTSHGLLERAQWRRTENTLHEGQDLCVYEKAL